MSAFPEVVYGLMGYPLSHSFSKKYFTQKFSDEGILGSVYKNFSIPSIDDFKDILESEVGLKGLNVTIPYKEQIIPFLDELSTAVQEIQAVNTIEFSDGKLIGHNTDVIGFEQSLFNLVSGEKLQDCQALVLGTGGAAKAIYFVLNQHKIPFLRISRNKEKGDLTYDDINRDIIQSHQLIINTTPLGTFPNINSCVDLPFDKMNENNFLFDLVYNPEKTLFLSKGLKQGCQIKNGLEMLELQAEAAYKIWTTEPS